MSKEIIGLIPLKGSSDRVAMKTIEDFDFFEMIYNKKNS